MARDHRHPPRCLDFDEWPADPTEIIQDHIEVEKNNRLFEKALIARGFYLKKTTGHYPVWRGPSGIEFSSHYVKVADIEIPRERQEDILTAIDHGVISYKEINYKENF